MKKQKATPVEVVKAVAKRMVKPRASKPAEPAEPPAPSRMPEESRF